MPLLSLKNAEKEELVELFLQLKAKGERYPEARVEIMAALRCLKAVHSNAIEDKSVDRIFLQLLLHGAGVPDKAQISPLYRKASEALRGHDRMLQDLEDAAEAQEPLSLSLLLTMHRTVFETSWPEVAGRLRQEEVSIARTSHQPPHSAQVAMLLHQGFATINEEMERLGAVTAGNFFEVLHLAARTHYLVAHVHPFRDGNGRISRALGDYVMLRKGMFYDVIMTDYREAYLDALEDCDLVDWSALSGFLIYSYWETLRRVAPFFSLVEKSPPS